MLFLWWWRQRWRHSLRSISLHLNEMSTFLKYNKRFEIFSSNFVNISLLSISKVFSRSQVKGEDHRRTNKVNMWKITVVLWISKISISCYKMCNIHIWLCWKVTRFYPSAIRAGWVLLSRFTDPSSGKQEYNRISLKSRCYVIADVSPWIFFHDELIWW